MGHHSDPDDLGACGSARFSRAVDLATEHPRTTGMLAMAGGTLAWYAMPDVIRSKGLRTVLKTAIIAAMAAALRVEGGVTLATRRHARPSGGDGAVVRGPLTHEERAALHDLAADRRRLAAVAVTTATTVAVSTWATVRLESWLFHRGEHRRAQGAVVPHVRQAVPLALAVAVVELLTDRAGRSTAAPGPVG